MMMVGVENNSLQTDPAPFSLSAWFQGWQPRVSIDAHADFRFMQTSCYLQS